MADETETELDGELEMLPITEVSLNDGSCWVMDPDCLAPECEAVGVLAMQYSEQRGLWILVGAGGDGEKYTQAWKSVAGQAGAKLTRVQWC